jgi:predicted nucleotidyltransferase
MNSLNEARNLLNAQKEYLFQKYPINSLAIFGSYARNEQSEKRKLITINR